jgi:hypothetical protein
MRRRPNQLLYRLLITSLIILAAMHPNTAGHLAELGAGLLLAIVEGITQAATNQPEAAALTAGGIYITHQIRTHRPAARATAH